MKKIYKVATHLDLKINNFKNMGGLFNRLIKKSEDAWVNLNVKYIYAKTVDDALNKYEKLFGEEYTCFENWMRWLESSENIDIFTDNKKIDIIDQYIYVVKEDCQTENITTLKVNMSAYDFRDWWHDAGFADEEMLLEKEN